MKNSKKIPIMHISNKGLLDSDESEFLYGLHLAKLKNENRKFIPKVYTKKTINYWRKGNS